VPAWSSPPVGERDCAAEQQYGGHCDHDSGASGHRDPPLVPSRPMTNGRLEGFTVPPCWS